MFPKMGCWLLTKEACAALAIAGCYSFNKIEYLPPGTISKVGLKLVSTIISLKHAGGSFAAHRALQEISSTCQRVSVLAHLPQFWVKYLLEQISSPDFVRDSILRRSTGYALGFLAIMRTDLRKGSSNIICPMVLSHLLRLSLPSKSHLHTKLVTLGLPDFEFAFLKDFPNLSFIEHNDYQVSAAHVIFILQQSLLDDVFILHAHFEIFKSGKREFMP